MMSMMMNSWGGGGSWDKGGKGGDKGRVNGDVEVLFSLVFMPLSSSKFSWKPTAFWFPDMLALMMYFKIIVILLFIIWYIL